MAQSQASDEPLKKSTCVRMCQSRLCLPVVFLAVAAGIAVVVPTVLLSDSLRQRYPPNLKWWQKTVVYQIYPRSFQDTNDDGVGDIKGITSKLDHFTYLNVETIWISPFYPSPMADFGYDVSNYTDVEPLFGTLDDFDEMLSQAHKKGLRVMVDFVVGHTSSEHPWFLNSVNSIPPYEDYYIWANGTTLDNGTRMPPSNWVSNFGYSAWEWNETRQQYYYHAYLPEQPTLNYRNPRVVEEMKNVLRFWLERGVDGIRVDAVGNMMVYEDYYRDEARSYAPGKESWEPKYYIRNLTHNRPEIADIVRGWRGVMDSYDDSDDDNDNYKFMMLELPDRPEVRNRYFDYGADIPINFQLAKSLNNEQQAVNACRDAICIRDVIQREYDALPKGKWANFVMTSHDLHRASSRMGARYVDALHVLLLTLRGTPTTYYGEEIGLEDIVVPFNATQDPKGIRFGPDRYQTVSRDPERSPMQWNSEMNAGFSNSSQTWLPVHPDFTTVNVEREKTSANMTTLTVYRNLTSLRKQPSLRYGLFTFGDVTSHLLSYLRSSHGNPGYLVVINFGNDTVTHDFSGAPVHQSRGHVKVVTSNAGNQGRFEKEGKVSLKDIRLSPGDGLVIEVAES